MLLYMTGYLLNLPRWKKRVISVFVDFIGLIFLTVLAIWLRLGQITLSGNDYIAAIAILPILAIPIFIKQGLYRAIVRYIGYRFTLTVFISVSSAILVWTAILFMARLGYPRSAIVITWLLALFYISGTRILARWLLSQVGDVGNKANRKRVVIFGAGSGGQQLLRAISKIDELKVIGFIDDDPGLIKHDIESIRVYAREDLDKMIKSRNVSELFLAIPSIQHKQRNDLIEWLEPFPIKVSTLPGMDEIVGGKIRFSDVREVDVMDLLGREPVAAQADLLEKCISNKVVLITGAGGSIGSEICRQVIQHKPKCVLLYELSEFALYQIEHELRKICSENKIKLVSLLGNVQDKEKIHKILKLYHVQTIYHAAAYKHVPLVEHNIAEGIYNNTFGTNAVALAAAEEGVENFVLISTDKAVRPTNVMGASKRMAEMALQALQEEFTTTRFIMVRFGNVLGSSGSVIPLFRKQIAEGGPVTVTHKEITRYFMTISEAASLVIQAGSMGIGGDVFVLDMGEPVKVDQLARKIINLSGLDVVDETGQGDIEIQYTGLRPGEKLYEELLIGDNVDGTDHPRIMKANEGFIQYSEFLEAVDTIKQLLANDEYDTVRKFISELRIGYHPDVELVDYLSIRKEHIDVLEKLH